MGIPDHLTYLLRNLYAGQEALYCLLRKRAVRAVVGKTARRLERAQAFRRFDEYTSVLLFMTTCLSNSVLPKWSGNV